MKTSRGILILFLATVLCLGTLGSGIAAGGNGYGKGGGGGARLGNGAGACIASDIVAAPEETIEGTVSSVGYYGQGISVDTGNGGIVQVFGIGPVRYWEDTLGEARPDVGEEIAVTGKEVTFSDGTTKFIAFVITITGEGEIVLRDEDGLPLWRGAGSMWRHRYMK